MQASSVTLVPADGPSVVILATASLQFVIPGWLRSEPELQHKSPALLPLLPSCSAVIETWTTEAPASTEPVHAGPGTRVAVSYVPPHASLPSGAVAESLVELLSSCLLPLSPASHSLAALTMNNCSLGPPGSFFHTPHSVLVRALVLPRD